MGLTDKKSQATLKKAVFALANKFNPGLIIPDGKLPELKILRDLASKISIEAGRSPHWKGGYLNNLLRYVSTKPKQFSIPREMLNAACSLVGLEQADNVAKRKTNSSKRNPITRKTRTIPQKNAINESGLNKINRKIKKGFGQGKGSNYVPWLNVREVPSEGLAHRIIGRKTGRTHKLLSKLEKWAFLYFDDLDEVTDIREQFPLPILETLQIANLLGIKHPCNPKTHEPIVMTSDFVITFQDALGERTIVRTVKPSSKLEKKRVLEKLAIEMFYWKVIRKTNWKIITEKQLPLTQIENIDHLRNYKDITDRIDLSCETVSAIHDSLRSLLNSFPLNIACKEIDSKFQLRRGMSLALAYHFIATKKWLIDLSIPIIPNHNIPFL